MTVARYHGGMAGDAERDWYEGKFAVYVNVGKERVVGMWRGSDACGYPPSREQVRVVRVCKSEYAKFQRLMCTGELEASRVVDVASLHDESGAARRERIRIVACSKLEEE